MSGKTKPQSTDAPIETTEPTTPTVAHTTKIVRVAGQDFSVPATDDNEAIRQQLIAMEFGVKDATIKQTKDADGRVIVEFIKKVGTKG